MGFVCVYVCIFFWVLLFLKFWLMWVFCMLACLLSKERKEGHGVGKWGAGQNLGGIGGEETLIRIYYMKNYFQ